MLHNSIYLPYERQKRSFKKLISSLFGLAGIYWLVIYGLGWAGIASVEDVRILRSGQSIIYFVLLTLWGVEYFREVKRLTLVIETSNSMAKQPELVTSADLPDYVLKFSVLKGTLSNLRTMIFPTINILGLALCTVFIALQYSRAVLLLVHR